MTTQNDKPSRLSIRLTPSEAQFVRRLSDTLRISRSQVIKQSLAYFNLLLSDQNDPNVGQTSDTLARAHGIYTSFIRYKRTTYPPPSVPEGATSGVSEEEEEENTISNTEKNTPSDVPNTEDDPLFEKWWLFYPKFQGMRPDKEKCRQAWHDLGANDGFDAIMDCTKRLKNTKSWQDGFVPMPLNYLRHKKWRDAPEHPPVHVIHGQ